MHKRIATLCSEAGEGVARLPALLYLSRYYMRSGALDESAEVGGSILRIAREADIPLMEAVGRLLEEGFTSLSYHKVTLRIALGNDASDRVAEKLGFTREGVLREELLIRGNWIDHSLWSLIDREYRSLHRSRVQA